MTGRSLQNLQGRQRGHVSIAWGTVYTLRKGHTVVVGVEKKKEKKSDHGRIAFYEHGGKSGMAMLKYPHIKKNAQPTKKVCIPRFAHRVA